MIEFAEFVHLLRDVVLIVGVILVTISVFLIAVVAFVLYRKAAPTLEFLQRTSQHVDEVSKTTLDQFIRPLAGNLGASINFGRVLGFLLRVGRKNRRKDYGEAE